jgi:LuxR family transcriptional regulator, maltose regulon positive regulatory protein
VTDPHSDLTFPPWLLQSRTKPPRQRQRLIVRDRIGHAMSRTSPGQLLLICGPPGFGKTVALAQWYDAERASGSRVAWFTADSADDPSTVLQYLAFACHVGGLDVSHSGLLSSPRLPLRPTLGAQALIGSIERARTSLRMVIDESDRISDPEVVEVLSVLARFLPDNMTLAFGTRDPDLLGLAAVAQRGLVRTIGADTLRFNRDELRDFWGRTVTAAQICAVEQRSGGWPALLQLMLQQRSVRQSDTTAASASGAAAVPIFVESHLLARMEPEMRRVLLRLSLLERFTPTLAEELTGATDAARTLTRLISLGIVTRETGPNGVEFAIHTLVRTYLAERFAADQPADASELHRDAARRYLSAGRPVLAVRHAAAVGDDMFLADTVEAAGPLLLGMREGFTQLRQIVRLIPERLALRRPRIGYAVTASYVKGGRLKEAQRLFELLDTTPSRLGPSSGSQLSERFERALCHSLLAVYKGTPIREADISALDVSTDTASLAPMLAETLRSFVHAQASRFTEAKASARRAIMHAAEGQSPYGAFHMYCDLGMLTGVEGNSAEAFSLFDEGDAACLSTVRLDERLTIIRDAFRFELEHELDPRDTTHAARLKNVCVRLPTLEGWLDVYAAAYRSYSEQLFIGGDLPAALTILSVGADHVREQEIEGIPAVLGAQRALLLSLAGRVEESRAELKALASRTGEWPVHLDVPWRVTEALLEARAVIDLASDESRSLTDLSRGVERAAATGNVRSEIRLVRLRSALLLRHDGRVRAATADANRLRLLEQRTGYRRSAELYGSFCLPSRDAGAPTVPVMQVSAATRTNYFSMRELDIIARLAREMSDKSIAMDLGISAHGVRYHLKRIYAKLHAKNRHEARAKAGRLGLPDPPTAPVRPPY